MGTGIMESRAAVDTKKAARRRLRFATPDELFAEVERLASAERAGRLRRTGNWTTGQVLGHLARWAEVPYGDYPLRPPAWVKMILRLMGKRKFVSEPMRVGVRIPGVPGGTLGTEALSLDEGLTRFTVAWRRLKGEAPTREHAIFGPMTHEEYIQANLRHAELHLGFLHPE